MIDLTGGAPHHFPLLCWSSPSPGLAEALTYECAEAGARRSRCYFSGDIGRAAAVERCLNGSRRLGADFAATIGDRGVWEM